MLGRYRPRPALGTREYGPVDNPQLPTVGSKGLYRLNVADWGQRPKDKDRDEAIAQIEAAAARGQIVDADKVKRIQEAKAAGTVGELDLITRGLAAPAAAAATPVTAGPPPVSDPAPVAPTFQTYMPPTTPPVIEPDPTPPPNVQYGEPLTPSTGTPIPGVTAPIIKRSGHGGKIVLLFVLVMIAGIAVPVFLAIRAVVDTVDDIDGIGASDVDAFSADGLDELAADLEKETGSSEVFSATLYPDYAYVEVPAESSGQRMFRYYWDGDLQQQSKGKATYPNRMDVRDIDSQVIQNLLAKISRKVEDATSNYVIAHAPGPTDEGASLYAYASNDFSEGGYVSATIDGKVIRTTTW